MSHDDDNKQNGNYIFIALGDESYQSLCCPHEGALGPWLPTGFPARTLFRLRRCTN